MPTGPKPTSLVGKTYHRLEVLELVGRDKWRVYQYRCKCVCGNEIVTSARRLITEATKSCGCWKQEHDNNRRGEKNPNYNPRLKPEDRAKRHLLIENRLWAEEVKKLADYTCKLCGVRGGDLTSHHLEAYHANPALRLDLNNGVCLCESCHQAFHKQYGNRFNTKAQFEEYINGKTQIHRTM